MRLAWNILATSTIVTLLAATFVLSQTPIYRATATIPTSTKNNSTELLSIQSADFLRTIVDTNEINFKLHSSLESYVVKGFGLTSRQKPTGKMTGEMKVTALQTNLHLDLVRNSNWINVHFESPDPKLAASLANLIAKTYLTTVSMSGDVPQPGAFPDKIDKAESELLVFLRDNPGAVSALMKLNSMEVDLKHWEDELPGLDASIEDERSVLKHLKSTGDLNKIAYDPVLTRDAGINLALNNRSKLTTERQQLSSRYGSHHLKIIALEKEIEESSRKLELQIDASIQRIENSIKLNKTKRNTANNKITMLKKTIIELQAQQLKYASLQLAIESAKPHLKLPGKVDGSTPNFSAAAIPVDPIRPRVKESLIVIFVLSLFVMAALILFRRKLTS